MILCMPSVGQKVRVSGDKPWTFKLYSEYRNYAAWGYFESAANPGSEAKAKRVNSWYDDFELDAAGKYIYDGESARLKHLPVTLPENTVLTIDRIYLRKGKGEFDSITFVLNKPKAPGKKKVGPMVRFWVRLDDVNNGQLEFLAD